VSSPLADCESEPLIIRRTMARPMQTRRTFLAAMATVGVAGCQDRQSAGNETRTVTDSGTTATADGTVTPPAAEQFWYTHAQPTGNRTLAGSGDLRDATPVTFAPDGRPQWLVGAPDGTRSHWTVVTTDGRVSHWTVGDGRARRRAAEGSLPAETPPVVATDGSEHRLLDPPADLSRRSSPVVHSGGQDGPPTMLYVARDGDLVVAGSARTRLAIDGLPDGRLAALGAGRYAVFGQPTDRYRHGALGDTVEATTLFVVDATEPAVHARASLDSPAVFEGLQPLVADIDGDGEREIVTTVADERDGARIAVFTANGERLATGPIHGPGWCHQLAVAPFGPGGQHELAVVRKPHVEHVVEFYRVESGALNVVGTAGSFASHT